MSKHLLPRLFFAGSAALLLATAATLTRDARAQDLIDDDQTVAEPTDPQSDAIKALLARCPGHTQPTCGTAASSGVTLYYYFP